MKTGETFDWLYNEKEKLLLIVDLYVDNRGTDKEEFLLGYLKQSIGGVLGLVYSKGRYGKDDEE